MKNDDAKNAANSENRAPDDQIFFTVDTSDDVESQVDGLVERIVKQ